MMKYSDRMILTHWLTLVLLILAWFLGDRLADLTDTGSATPGAYMVHGAAGGAILLLTVLRLFFRSMDGTPQAMGNTPMDKLAKGIQHMMYLILFILPISGILTVFTSDAGHALLSGDAHLLPKEDGFQGVFAHQVHGTMVTVLVVLVAVHIAGAIKHQFIMKDGLMDRMSLRRK